MKPLDTSPIYVGFIMYQDAADNWFWYGYDDGTKLAHESDQEDDESTRLHHSQ